MSSAVLSKSEPFLDSLLGGLRQGENAAHESMRQRALEKLATMTLPSANDEDWRFSSLEALRARNFTTAARYPLPLEAIEKFILPEAARLVFVDGYFSAELSDTRSLDGIIPGAQGLTNDGVNRMTPFHDAFSLLNAAMFADEARLSVPKGVECSVPMHLLFVSTAGKENMASHPRLHVSAAPNSSLTVFEEYVSIGEAAVLTNAVAMFFLAEGARVQHCKLQRENVASFHIGNTYVEQERNSAYHATTVTLGAAFSRQEPQIVQSGEGAESSLLGLAMVSDHQLADTHSTVDHTKPHGTSRQLHKCIVDGHARAVFNGKILVRKDAQQINSTQSSRTLLLSDHARVNTKPQLEIFADDVKCSHGATVGQLDPDEIFYLQSRGLSLQEARSLLTYAFAAEVLESVPIPFLKHQLQRLAFAMVPAPEGK